jgi:hypothetical protein
MSDAVRWVPGLTPRPTGSDTNRGSSSIASGPSLTVNDKLAKLRLETRRQALNKRQTLPLPSSSSQPPPRYTRHPGYIFLAPQTLSSDIKDSRPQLKRVAGPPPPFSWQRAFAITPHPNRTDDLSGLDLTSSVWYNPDSERLVRRRRQIKGIVADDRLPYEGPRRPSHPLSLLDSCLLVIARDTEPYTGLVSLVPIHLIMRILELATIYAPLADAAIQTLLLPDGGDARSEEDSAAEECQEPPDPDRETSWEDLVCPASPLDWWTGAACSFSSLGILDLCFSGITLTTLRSLLFFESTANHPWTTTTTTIRLPSLHTLLLAHTPNLLLSPPLLSLLTRLNSLHVLSLAHKRDPAYPARVFLSRLAASTPLLRMVDLGYSEWIQGPGDLEGVDWSTRWRRLELIVLRGCGRCSVEGDMSARRERVVQNLVTGLLREKGRTAPWLQVQT